MLGRNSQNELERPRVDDLGRLMVSTAGESTTTEYNIDDPSVGDEYGIINLGIRRDDDTSPVSANGDLHPFLFNSQGRLKVSAVPGIYDAVSGNLTTLAQTLAIDVTRSSNVVLHVKNTGSAAMAAGAFTFEGSLDSTNGTDGTWFAIQVVRSNANTIELATGTLSLAAGAGLGYSWEASVNAYNWIRVRCTTTVTTNSIATWRIQRGSHATEPIPAMQTHAVSGTVTSNIGTAGLTTYTDSSTNLAAAASFTGTSRDGGATPAYNYFVASAFSDQAGTLKIQKSTDNTTWRDALTVSVAAGVPQELTAKCTARCYRVLYTNGATLQTQFLLTSAYQRI